MRTVEPDKLVLTEARPRTRYLELEAEYVDVDEASDEGDDWGNLGLGTAAGHVRAGGKGCNGKEASPPSSWKERIAFARKRGDSVKEQAKAAKKDKNEPSRFMGEGVSFKAKLIGILEVAEARGDRMCQDALADLKMAIRAAGEHKQRITINIAIDGLRLRDEKTGDCLFHHPVHKISFIAQDMTDSRAFGYIFGSPDTGHRFFGIKTDKAASQVVVSMRDLFQVVFELKKKEIEMAKQHIEQHHLKVSNTSLSSTSGSAATVTYMESMAHHLKESGTVRENGSSGAAAASSSSASATKTEQPSEAIADLLDLEFELNSIQQGIHQMDRITPSDPCGPAKDDPFSTDPFGDSFAAGGPNKPPSSAAASSLSNKTAAAPVACLPPPPSVKDSVRADGTGTHRRERAAKVSAAPAGTASPAGLAPLAQEEKHWFDQETEALFDETELSQALSSSTNTGSSKQDQDAARLSPLDPLAPSIASDQFDVFTELDPLGTGRSKPYVDKKDFFQDLKNPPKKVLKDLVGEADPLSAPLFQASFETGSGSRDSGALGDVLSALDTVPGSSATATSSFPTFPDPFADDPFDKTDPFAEGSFSQSVSFSPNTVMPDPFETGFADFSSFPPGSRNCGASTTASTSTSTSTSTFPSASSSSGGAGLHGPLRVTLPPEKTATTAPSSSSQPQASNCLSPSPPLSSGNSKQRTRFTRLHKQSSVSQLVKLPSPKSSQRSRSRLSKQVTVSGDGSQSVRFPPLGSSPTPPGPLEDALRRSPVSRGTVTPSPPSFPGGDTDADAGSRLSGSSAELSEIAPEPPPRPTPNAFSIKPPPLPPKKHHTGAVFKPPPRPPQQEDHSHYDHIENYESSSSPTPLDAADAKSPPIPVPARKPRLTDETSAPLRPKKHGARAETEDGYLAPIPFLPPPVKRNQSSQPSAVTSKTSLDITLSQLTKTGFADLASTLGMSPSQLSKMTLQELTRCLASLSCDSATQASDVQQTNRGSLAKTEYSALRESIDEDSNFAAEFEDNFDTINVSTRTENSSANRESLYDKYAVFRELLEQTDHHQVCASSDAARQTSSLETREDPTDLAGQTGKTSVPHSSPITINILPQPDSTSASFTVSSVSPSTSPATIAGQQQQSAPSIDRYAALREISLCDEAGSNRDEEEDEREAMDIEGYAEVENDVSDKDDSMTEVVRNDEDQDLLTLSGQHSESTESPTLDTATVRDAPSIMETTILEEDVCSVDGDVDQQPPVRAAVATPLSKSSAADVSPGSLDPVPESLLETGAPSSSAHSLTNGTHPSPRVEAVSSAHTPALERPILMKETIIKSPGESWAKFDSSQFEKPVSDEAASPWSSDGKEFSKASVGWKDDSDHGSSMRDRDTGRRGSRRQRNRGSGSGSGAWPEDEESEDVSEDQRSVSDRWENGWSDRESFDEAPPSGGRPPRYQEPRRSRRRKLSPWRKGTAKSSREASPWEGSDCPQCPADDRGWAQDESDFKRAWKMRPKNRGPSWEEERRMRGSWEGDISEYEEVRGKRRQPSSPWASEDDWYPRRPPPERSTRRRDDEHRRRWEYERDRDRDRYGYRPRAHPHYRERCSPEFAWDDELSEQGEDDSPHGHPQGRKWRWSRPSSAASRSGHERVSPSSDYSKARPDEDGHPRRRYRDHGGSSVERRSRSRDDIFNSDQEHDYWPAQEQRVERTRSRTERDARYDQRSQTLHSRRSNRSRYKTYDQPSPSVSFTQKSPFEDDFSAQRFDFVSDSKSFSQDSSLEIGETSRSPSVKVYAPRKKDSLSESEEARGGDAVFSSPLEVGRGRGSSIGSSRRQSPFEDDFTPPETRNNSARHMSSASSDVSDQHRLGAEDMGSRSNSRPGSGRTRRIGGDIEPGSNGRSTDDVFLPAEHNVPDTSPVSTLEPVISPNRPLSEHRRSLRSGEDKNLVGMKARLSNLRRTDSSSSLRKSESINIFARSCDPFDDDDFFNGDGSSPQGQPSRSEQSVANRQSNDHFKWTEAFESFNFEEGQ